MGNKLHFKQNELIIRKEPEQLGLEFTSVQRIELDGERTFETMDEEICFVLIEGQVDFKTEQISGSAYFKDMIYVPWRKQITLFPQKKSILMCYGAPAHRDTYFDHISFVEVDKNSNRHIVYGEEKNNSKRDVWNYIDDRFDACRLLIGICQGKTGGWTVWPPHEHSEEREEVYTYFDMGKAFGVQCVYEDMDQPLVVAMVRDGDVISVPRGYHPNVSCPAGRISFIYCMVARKADERKFMDLRFQKIYGNKFVEK
jgi:5-deoxy-glucuronate isomerase